MPSITWYLKTMVAVVATGAAAQIARTAGGVPAGVPVRLTSFGERPSWSPDGRKIAFMSKSFGDAFEMDLETEEITLLTDFPNAGFLRAQYLPNGDMFLIGARTFEDIDTTRSTQEEMWVLKRGEETPVPLGQKIFEGVAISRQSSFIAWANNYQQYPDIYPENVSAIYTAEIVYNNGIPALANKREIIRAIAPACALEPQDFRNNDTELIYTCYTTSVGLLGDVLGVDLATGKTTVYRSIPGEYNEVEGIYPNSKYTLVESTHGSSDPSSTAFIDIWRLALEPNSTDFVRLTFFTNDPPNKAGNPVVSPDGRTMAVQIGRAGTAAGVGFGIVLIGL